MNHERHGKHGKIRKVPKLRFPEFLDKGEWEKQKFNNLLRKISSPVKVEPDEVYQEIGIRSHGKGIFHKEPINGKGLGNKRVFWVEENAFIVNIVFAWELAVASTTETEKGMIASHRFPMYQVYDNRAVVSYIKYFFLTNKGKELLWIASPGGAGRNKTLGQKEFENLEFLIPRFVEEQQRIADCLTSLDELITAEAGKLEAYKAHKKGLMQKLFPAEGKTVPEWRFPEFRSKGEWEETTIGNIGSFYYGKSAPKWSLEEDAPTRCVRYGELYTKFGAIITETYSRTNIDPNNLRFSKGGEILVPRVGEKPEDFGKCCCYLSLGNIAIGEMISVFETAQNPLFYTYYFRNLYRQFAKVVEGQNVKNLYYVELKPLPIRRPSLPEQQKIANCLTALDELILTRQLNRVTMLRTQSLGA